MSHPSQHVAWKFPDEDQLVFQEAEAYRALPVNERLHRMMAVIELGLAMQDANPRRDAVRALCLREEEQQQAALRKVFQDYESQRNPVAGRG